MRRTCTVTTVAPVRVASGRHHYCINCDNSCSTLSNAKHDLPLFAANALDSSANEDHLALVALDVNTA